MQSLATYTQVLINAWSLPTLPQNTQAHCTNVIYEHSHSKPLKSEETTAARPPLSRTVIVSVNPYITHLTPQILIRQSPAQPLTGDTFSSLYWDPNSAAKRIAPQSVILVVKYKDTADCSLASFVSSHVKLLHHTVRSSFQGMGVVSPVLNKPITWKVKVIMDVFFCFVFFGKCRLDDVTTLELERSLCLCNSVCGNVRNFRGKRRLDIWHAGILSAVAQPKQEDIFPGSYR